MPYPKRLLNDGEEVALDLKPHWWFFSKQVFTGVPLFILFVVFLQVVDSGTTLGSILWWAWGIGALVWAGWLGIKYLDWMFTYFVVTGDRVVYRTGVLAKKGVEIPLDRINNINFGQRVWERVIGAGDLSIESAGRDGQSVFSEPPDGGQRQEAGVVDLAGGRTGCGSRPRCRRTGGVGSRAAAAARRPARQGRDQPRGVRGEEGRAARPDVKLRARAAAALSTTRVLLPDRSREGLS